MPTLIHEYNGGYVLLLPEVGSAKKLPQGWKVRSSIGMVWDSIFIPGKKVDVKFVKTKAEAKRVLRELEAMKVEERH